MSDNPSRDKFNNVIEYLVNIEPNDFRAKVVARTNEPLIDPLFINYVVTN